MYATADLDDSDRRAALHEIAVEVVRAEAVAAHEVVTGPEVRGV